MMWRRLPGTILLLLVLLAGGHVAAQDARVDTTVADTVVVGAEGTTGSTMNLDTSSLTNAGQETGQADVITLRHVPDTAVDRFKNNRRFAYANDPAYWTRKPVEKAPGYNVGNGLKLISYLIYFLLAAVLVFVVVRIVQENNLGFFYRSRKPKGEGTGEEIDTPAEEDLDERLQHYLDHKEHRQAVRYLYLRSLRKLGDRELIRPVREATNEEYVRQLRGTSHQEPFRFLTRAYEKVWYGEFPLSEGAFRQLFQYFMDFDKRLGVWAFLILFACGLGSCGGSKKQLNRRVSLSRQDDIPYGTRVAYEELPHLFPDADITINRSSATNLSSGVQENAKKALIAITPYFGADSLEVQALMGFVGDGNQVFISATRVSEYLLHNLSIRATMSQGFGDDPDSLKVGVIGPTDQEYKTFAYPGDSYDNWITALDSQYTTILGRDGRGHADFIRIGYKGGGAIYLHFAPLAFSNFFLLHKKNIAYYENALSYIPSSVKNVIWDDYYRYEHSHGNFSALQYIFRNPALTWAFWLLLLLFALIYIFDSRRRQREIPVIPPLSNTSLDFVRTIGRLYFQRRDNHNLASKMVIHFLDQVRTRYHLPVAALDESFVDRLAYRTGYPKQALVPLVQYMQELPAIAYVSDEDLLQFHRQLEEFYKHT
jgi:hypothetical protein